MENEIAKALADGKDVTLKIDITYENDSNRPSKIKVTYTIDGKETIVVFDNNEDSSELMNELQEIADDDACQDLQDEIQDARMNGENVSVMSLKQEYDEQGNLMDIVVCVRYDGENHYRMIAPKQED
jgi:hypothetical protein